MLCLYMRDRESLQLETRYDNDALEYVGILLTPTGIRRRDGSRPARHLRRGSKPWNEPHGRAVDGGGPAARAAGRVARQDAEALKRRLHCSRVGAPMRRACAVCAISIAAAFAVACRSTTETGVVHATRDVDVDGMDRRIKPGDDFFAYANGTWIERTEIPADRASWGTGAILAELTDDARRRAHHRGGEAERARRVRRAQGRRLLRELHGRGGDRGEGPHAAAADARRIAAINDATALARELGGTLRADVDVLNATDFDTDNLFGLWVAQDLDDPTQLLAVPAAGRPRHARSRLLPRRVAAHGRASARSTRRTSRRCLELAGDRRRARRRPRASSRSRRRSRKAHATRERHRGRAEGQQPLDARRASRSSAPGLDWNAFFGAAGLDKQHDVRRLAAAARSPASPRSSRASRSTTWKDYLTFHAVEHARSVPAEGVRRRGLRVLRHGAQRHARAARALEARASTPPTTRSARPSASSTSRSTSRAAEKARAEAMVAEHHRRVRDAHRRARRGWRRRRRRRPRRKLAALKVGVGYPDKWRDYSRARGRARRRRRQRRARGSSSSIARNSRKLGKPVDRGEWVMTPQLVNAVNLPAMNALNFPAAILQPPYFDPTRPTVDGLRRDRRRHRPRDQPQLRRSGRAVRRRTASCRTGGRTEDLAHFKASGAALVEAVRRVQAVPRSRT